MPIDKEEIGDLIMHSNRRNRMETIRTEFLFFLSETSAPEKNYGRLRSANAIEA